MNSNEKSSNELFSFWCYCIVTINDIHEDKEASYRYLWEVLLLREKLQRCCCAASVTTTSIKDKEKKVRNKPDHDKSIFIIRSMNLRAKYKYAFVMLHHGISTSKAIDDFRSISISRQCLMFCCKSFILGFSSHTHVRTKLVIHQKLVFVFIIFGY